MNTTNINQGHPATDSKAIPVPDHLLIPLVESAFNVVKKLEEGEVPTSLRRIAHFDSKALNHSTARSQIIQSISSSSDFARMVEDEFFSRVEVSSLYMSWSSSSAQQIISEAAQRNDLALIASILWLKRPEHYEYALGMIVSYHEIALDENAKIDSQRAQETQFNHTQKSLTREKERAELLTADVRRLEEELRHERSTHRSKEQQLKAEAAALQKQIDQNQELVERTKDARDRNQQRIEREASRAAELESRLRLAQEESSVKSVKIDQLQEQLASSLSSDIQLNYEDLQNLILAQNEAQAISNSILKIMNKTRTILSQKESHSPVEKPKTSTKPARTAVKVPAGRTLNDPEALKTVFAQENLVVIVDGYNVSLNSFEQLSLELQREKVIACATSIESRYKPTCVVIFDGDSATTRGRVQSKVHVVFSPADKIADDVIVERVRVTPLEVPMVIITNDKNLSARVKGLGCEVVSTQAFVSVAG